MPTPRASDAAALDLPDLLWALGSLPNTTIDSVRATSTVTDDAGVYRLVRAEQRLDGEWIRLNKDTPAQVRAGHRLRLRLVLTGPDGVVTTPLSYWIPADAAGQRGRLSLSAGSPLPFEQGDLPTTLRGFTKLLRTFVRTDQYEGTLSFGPMRTVQRTKKTAPADRVVTGDRGIKVIVE